MKSMISRLSIKFVTYGFAGLLIGIVVISCSHSTEPESQTYTRTEAGNREANRSQISAFAAKGPYWQNRSSQRPLNMAWVRGEQGEVFLVEETIEPPADQYAADEALAGKNISSMIEGKIYNLIEDAYRRRDYNEFIKLYSLFVESFPHSSQKSLLDEKRKTFFYRENLNIKQLQGALVEVTYPDATSFQELGLYFESLKDQGIGSVQMNVVQVMGTPVFLFADKQKGEGYYFSNFSHVTVDDVLDQITQMAHDNGLLLFASFPLRHHPRLGGNAVFLLDESWNIFQNRTTPNEKLDLLNPDSRVYLLKLIEDLMASNIDGIVLKDDFTYDLNEGFSEIAQDRYRTATGQPLAFNKMFVPVPDGSRNRFEILTSDEFHDVALWRSREIAQLLWDIVSYVKASKPDFRVGIEVTPEMLLESFEPQKWLSTGLKYLKDLQVDFFVLKWRRFNSDQEAEMEEYEMAVDLLRSAVPEKREIFVKIPLSQMTKNTIELNRKIEDHAQFQKEYKGIRIAVGPVNRMEKLDIVN